MRMANRTMPKALLHRRKSAHRSAMNDPMTFHRKAAERITTLHQGFTINVLGTFANQTLRLSAKRVQLAYPISKNA